jgi:PKD repeat protein
MIAASLAGWRRWSLEVRCLAPRSARTVASLASLVLLAACSEQGILGPTSAGTPAPAGAGAHAAVVVTPSYSTFTTRAELGGAGIVDGLSDFEEFTGKPVYDRPTPWTTHGVTYTSALNIVLGPGIELGVASNALSTEYGAPLTGQFAATDAFTLFGADAMIIGANVPVRLVISTNLGSYTFDNLGIPLATAGRRFFGLALSRPGEYLTGFRFTVQGSGTTVLLDDVAVGHVAERNADPEVSVGGPYTAIEGSAVTLTTSATDADGDPLTFSWDLGDGTKGSGAVPPASHTYADNGSYDIVLAVADGRGGVDTARTTATIENAAPALAAFSVPGTAIALTPAGVTVPVASTFTDPGTDDTHTATLDCGVGDLSAALVDAEAAVGSVAGTCAFSSAGVYTVRLTIRDDDGASDTELASGYVVVYDPSAGWVTGGGWIESREGAYAEAPAAGGKLSFALLVRYQANATTPSGNADFKLNAAKLDFRSTAFDWMALVGSTVRVQGRGTLNGVGDYAFAVVASDGVADAIRIRIWHRVTGAVVYDNEPGQPLESDPLTALGGGSLEVHQR